MTLSEIAQTHEGRCFTAGSTVCRFSRAYLEFWVHGGREWEADGISDEHTLARTDWEFCPDPSQPEPTYDLRIGQALDAEIAGKKVEAQGEEGPHVSALAAIRTRGYSETRRNSELRESRWRIVE